MNIEELIKYDYDITHLTTFGIPVRAAMFAEYSDVKQLTRLSRTHQFLENEVLHIGGGSNLLFVNDFDGLILHSNIRGITRYDKDSATTYVIAGAGEKWTDLVDWSIAQGLSGLENMAGIPGEVGASAVQNVGAYGMEASDVIHAVECFDLATRTTVRLTAAQCRFGYRDSIFKHSAKGRYIVIRVSYKLKPGTKAECLTYGPLRDFAKRIGHHPTTIEVKKEIERIRNEKLPDPKKTGSAGSFFKNPVLPLSYFTHEVSRLYPDIPYHKVGEDEVKLSAAWLIDRAGMKGKTEGGAIVYPTQPLVIANKGGATASDVTRLAKEIEDKVMERFGIRLSPEVNYIDTAIDVTILGSGTSKGVPEIGCKCAVCKSDDPHDKRQRSSVLLRTHGMNILIDAGPDVRSQMLANDVDSLDAVLLTHSHTDHIGGLDDLRPFCFPKALPLYMREDVEKSVRKHYDYCFVEHPYPGAPKFELQRIDNQSFRLNGLKIIPIEVFHGSLPIFGYRIGAFAYVTDAKKIEEREMEKLYGLDLLILNALRDRDHFAHLTIEEALNIIEEVKPKRALLTHLCHEAGLHIELCSRLEEFSKRTGILVAPAFDGERIIVK